MWAASYEDGVGIRAAKSVVDLLLKAGAEVDAVDDRGRTALMMAADLDHAEVVDMLIRSGADSIRYHRGEDRRIRHFSYSSSARVVGIWPPIYFALRNSLFDYLVGGGHGMTECLGGLDVDGHLKFGRQLFGGFAPRRMRST
jgi:hypothetical protein